MRFLALSGSLRAASINCALLRAVARLAPDGIDVQLFDGLGQLPLFNPDLETNLPAAVARLYDAVATADALIIASPEYAHGVTGTIKNALDWLVSFESFVHKRVAVLNASPRAHHADAALRETLKTMSAIIVESASVTLPILGSGLDEEGIVCSPSLSSAICQMLESLRRVVDVRHSDECVEFPLT